MVKITRKTLFMTAANLNAILVVNSGNRRRKRTLTFADEHAALDWCLHRKATFYQPGNVVTERAFTSAATDRSGSHLGRLRFEIISKTGKSLSGYSSAVLEDEILFDQGTQFKVLEARWHGGALHVKLEEL